ncbi:MAG: glucose-6-phosphate isomerase, partial [Pirellulales bacterium]
MAGSQLTYDPSAVFLDKTGITPQELAELAPRLNAARQETLDDVELWKKHDNSAIPADKQPLDAGFIDLPERLLDEYDLRRDQSELDQILSTGKHLAAKVDRVVVLGIGGSYMGTRALFEACCHPYHNDLGRAERGSHPRIYFEGNNVDNDALNGLLDLLGRGKPASRVAEDWGLIIVSKSGGTLETAAATRIMLRVLREAVQGDPQELAKRVAAVTGASGKLFNLATALGCSPIFNIPDGVGGRFSIFTAVGLLPATVLGLDVRKLLEGAADMNRRFRSAPPGENPVLDFVGVGHLMEVKRGA